MKTWTRENQGRVTGANSYSYVVHAYLPWKAWASLWLRPRLAQFLENAVEGWNKPVRTGGNTLQCRVRTRGQVVGGRVGRRSLPQTPPILQLVIVISHLLMHLTTPPPLVTFNIEIKPPSIVQVHVSVSSTSKKWWYQHKTYKHRQTVTWLCTQVHSRINGYSCWKTAVTVLTGFRKFLSYIAVDNDSAI